MNYIYDILLNFDKQNYDFFDWDDNTIHIKKIPLFRINNEQMKIVINNNIKIDINEIKNKTELFTRKTNKNMTSLVVANNFYIIALNLDKEGNVIGRSSLLFEEETDILEIIEELEITNLNIKIISKLNSNLLTKKENQIYDYVINEIRRLVKNKEDDKLIYLYYECFNKKEVNIKKVVEILKEKLDLEFELYGNLIYNFFKLTAPNK